jgi:hypothetical protein
MNEEKIIKSLITVLLLTLSVYSQEFLIHDYDFTNQDYTEETAIKFCNSFQNNSLTTNDIKKIVWCCKRFKINIVFVFAKMQMESGIIDRLNTNNAISDLKNKIMGYGISEDAKNKKTVYRTFNKQIYYSIKRFRYFFDEWSPGKQKYLIDLKRNIIPMNAATWALYRYTPFYDNHKKYGWKSGGNRTFILIYERFKNAISKQKRK